ncbi:MAG: NAD(P)-dependent alcohol dehydrogenase [Planctomycetes bacterium]|nr:NAD(P)-dependent alcohol dehydrogenase [Planctomycetota bacterium]
MKRYVIDEPGPQATLRLEESPDAIAEAGEVLVRVKACSLNYRDLMVLRGSYGEIKQPLVPLSDCAGEVVAVGAGVDGFEPGDRVAGCFFQNWQAGRLTKDVYGSDLGFGQPGVLCELRVFHQHGLVKLPRYVSFVEGACLPCAGLTAFNAVVPHIARDRTVLLLGTGGVSLFALQFAKASGASVIITSSDDAKLERAKANGADHGINYRTIEKWDDEVLRLTDGHGVELVVETGGAQTLERSINSLAPGGHVSLLGQLTGKATGVNVHGLVYKGATMQGVFVGSKQDFLAMNAFVPQLNMAGLIDDIVPFNEAPRAFERIASGKHFGKVVITTDQSSR